MLVKKLRLQNLAGLELDMIAKLCWNLLCPLVAFSFALWISPSRSDMVPGSPFPRQGLLCLAWCWHRLPFLEPRMQT